MDTPQGSEPEFITPDNHVESTPESIESSPVVPATEEPEHVEVKCVGCNNTYGFDIDSQTEGFTFVCQLCRTETAWTRA